MSITSVRAFLFSVLLLVLVGAADAQQRFVSSMSGLQTVPVNNSNRTAAWPVILNATGNGLEIRGGCGFPEGSSFSVHRNAAVGENVPPLFTRPLQSGTCSFTFGLFGITPDDVTTATAAPIRPSPEPSRASASFTSFKARTASYESSSSDWPGIFRESDRKFNIDSKSYYLII